MIPRGILVTGAGASVGRAIAKAFAAETNNDLLLHHHRNLDAVAETAIQANEIRTRANLSGQTILLQADLCDVNDVKQVVDQIATHQLACVVCAAGTMPQGRLETLSAAEWMSTLQMNLVSTGLLLQDLYLNDQLAHDANIILIGDLSAHESWPGFLAHAASKAALRSMMQNLAIALAPDIRVNMLTLGIVSTPKTGDVPTLLKKIPLKRFGTSFEVGHAAVYLHQASYLTGHELVLDGGQSAR